MMNVALALFVTLASQESPVAPGVVATGSPETAPVGLIGEASMEALCRALEPSERLRPKGDALVRSQAEDAHESARRAAVVSRYRVVALANQFAFAEYDAAERRLRLAEAVLPLGAFGRIFTTMERGLPAQASLETAQKILEAQKGGKLELVLDFDLPDDATCSPGKPRVLSVEPVTWSWRTAGEELARGGAGAERPVIGITRGAHPTVTVGEPVDGPQDTRQAVSGRAAGLKDCYQEALSRIPTLDGVLVAKLTPSLVVIAADSVGDDGMAVCVSRVLAGIGTGRPSAAVPIRFDLEPPDSSLSDRGR